MSMWLFDLGNTRLKFARSCADGSLADAGAVAHEDGEAWLRALPRGDAACIASVAADERRVALLDALCARFGRLHLVRTQSRCGGLRIAYENPRHLGVDRFLALLSALDAGDVLLVGIGTALTIDLLDAGGWHHGGRIAPSPMLMRQALHARAPVLPESGGAYAEFAGDTGHALASGCEGAALALIERSLERAQGLLGAAPALWLHGGGAMALRDRLPPHRHVPDAVLRGLARWQAQAFA
ncbi:type III pantothenate kinase [Thermomonas aquatica]|uniref:Type III pantothenate kinase n=1 Tax=Thermomonas aquatica TaxID=2202149 RepID=A0A5B7ZRF4_9GAMM|nr:type III pantothenate kinase [Thermomonas aquatica]QDA57066.1 type III pantothenate kinase [Thermomonas aquatica]